MNKEEKELKERQKSNEDYLMSIYQPLSRKVSKYGRVIIFGVITAFWGIIATGKQNFFPLLNSVLVIKYACLYIAMDMFQYLFQIFGFYSLFWFNQNYKKAKIVYERMDIVEKIDWGIFSIKIIYLFLFFIEIGIKL